MSRKLLFLGLLLSLPTAAASAGPYAAAKAAAIAYTDSNIVEWATGATINRGLAEIDNPSLGYASYGGPNGSGTSANTAPIGEPPSASTSYAVALGQGGTATLTFAQPITNGAGYDFAVFGNGFSVGTQEWVKPAFVEVSSDGVNFFRFPSVSLTQATTQVGSYGDLDPTNLYDLAGKDPAGYGTQFDLSEMAGVSPLLNVGAVTEVRLVDCIGDINPAYATYDSQGHIVNGPWPASSLAGSEGFCLAGVGVMNEVPEPTTLVLAASGMAAVAMYCWQRRACKRRRSLDGSSVCRKEGDDCQ